MKIATRRVVTKIGDVFSVSIADEQKKFFQLIAFDITQLNSDVIRVFEQVYPIDSAANMDEVVKGKVQFYAHCVTKWGVKLGYWQKEGKSLDIGELDGILFRNTNDYGMAAGEEPVRV